MLAVRQVPSRCVARLRSAWSADRVDFSLTVIGWLAVLAFILMTVAPGLLPGKVFLGTDRLADFAPWSQNDVGKATNIGITDTIDSVTPKSILTVDSARAGAYPQWDPYSSGGAVLGAVPNSTALLSPLSLPWWILPHDAAQAGVKILECLAISLGMHGLLRRRWRLPACTAPIASLTYITSGFMLSWTNWPQTRVAALIPLLFCVGDSLAVRARRRDVLYLAIVLASMLLGGFPAVTAYGVYAVVAYFVVRAAASARGLRDVLRSFGYAVGGGILSVLLAAVQIFPFVWFSQTYVDFESRAEGNGVHLPASLLASVTVPNIFGYPNGDHGDWPVHFIEGASYVGAAAAVLVVAVLVLYSRRRAPRGVVPFFAAALLLVGVAVYAGGPALALVEHLPGISGSFSGRLRVLVGFFAAVLAGLGMAAVVAPSPLARVKAWKSSRPVRWAWRLLEAAAAIAILWALVAHTTSAINPDDRYFDEMWIAVTVAVVLCTVVVVLCAALAQRVGVSVLGGVLVIVMVTVPAASTVSHWWPVSDEKTFYGATDTTTYLRQHLGSDRFASVGTAMLSGTSVAYGLRSVNGHTFASGEWRTALEVAAPDSVRSSTYTSFTSDDLMSGMRSGILDRMGVKYVVSDPMSAFPGEAESVPQRSSEKTFTESSGTFRTTSSTGPVRGIQLAMVSEPGASVDPGMISIRLVSDEDGSVLASAEEAVNTNAANNGLFGVPGEDIPANVTWHAEITLSESVMQFVLGVDDSGTAIIAPYRAVDDGLKLVYANDALVWERTTALHRVRWAGSSVVITNAAQRLTTLQNGSVSDDTVVLEHQDDAQKSDESSSATVSTKDITTDEYSVSVDSTGAGWVVLEDSLRHGGWSVTVDGRAATLVDADDVGSAVYIASAGHHTITLTFEAPYFKLGTTTSIVTILAVLVAVLWDRRRARGRRLESVVVEDSGETPTESSAARRAGVVGAARRRLSDLRTRRRR